MTKSSLYTSFSNYEEKGQSKREYAADLEAAYFGDRKPEYIRYRKEWNKAANDPLYTPKIPLCVTVDASSLCNLRCLGCHQSLDAFQRGNKGNLGYADSDKVEKIIDQAASLGVPSFSFAWKGEPSLNYYLPQMIKRCTDKGILETRVVSNGLSPLKDIYIRMCEAGLTRLIFSVDGHSSDSYETYRRGGDYEKLMANIGAVLDWKEAFKSHFPLIRIQCVRNKFNEKEIDDFLEYWWGMEGVDDVRISDVMDRTSSGGQSQYSCGDQVTTGRKFCPQPRQRLVFSQKADKAYTCCHDWNNSYPVGDIEKMDLLEIWNSKPMQRLREKHASGNWDDIPMCKTGGPCSSKETFVWSKRKK